MKFIFSFILLFSVIFAEEPSVFEMQSSVTKKEIEELKRINDQQSDRILKLENQIKQLEISLEGLKSIYEGSSSSLKDLNDKINSFGNNSNVDDALNSVKEDVVKNTNNIQMLKDSIDSYVKQIQELITNEMHNKQQNNIDSNKTSPNSNTNIIKKIIDNNATNPNGNKDIIDNSNENIIFDKDTTRRSEIFKEARSLTYSKKFDEAIARYKWFIEINYKKAESNYMLGNIAYEQNRYKDAVYYYKESAILDDKAKYMPRLLLNSANSFRVLNDKDNSQNFYNALIDLFPESVEAKEAKKIYSKLIKKE